MLRLYDRLDQKTAIQFVDRVLEKLPFRVEVIPTSNGADFQWHGSLLRASEGDPALFVEDLERAEDPDLH